MQNTNELVCDKDTGFSLIYKTYHKRMHAYGIAIGFCKYLCSDAIQDVFCALYVNQEKLEQVENVEAYLLHCLKNRLFDMYKDQKRMNCTGYNDLIIDQDVDSIGKIINEENELLRNEEIARLLKKLNPKQRTIIYSRFHHNLKFNEIAVLVDMSPDAVKKLLYRTLKTMKRECRDASKGCSCFFSTV